MADGVELIDPPSTETRPRGRRFRWKSGLAILAIGVVAELLAWNAFADDATQRVMATYYVIPPLVLALLIWWTFFSGIAWKARLGGLATLGAGVALLLTLFRADGFGGDMVPRFAFRWGGASPEDTARQFWKGRGSQGAGAPSREITIDETDWPQFRGPLRDGIVRNANIRIDWKAEPPELVWKHPVGPAWSSFAVVDDFVFTQEQRDDNECVVCYDLATGNEIWSHAEQARYDTPMGGIGPRCTPTVHDSRLYALGATGILNCLDPATGNVLWARNILDDTAAGNLEWGMAGSPLVYDEFVVVVPGGPGKCVQAYDRISGEPRWSTGDDKASYSAARIEQVAGTRQLLVFGGTCLSAYEPTGGKFLWRSPEWTNMYKINVAQPIALDEDSVFVGSGYGTGSMRLDLAKEGDEWKVTPQQFPNELKLKFNCAVLHEGHVYGLDDGILMCFDPIAGESKWKRGRYGFGQILLVDGRLIVQSEDGEVLLLDISPERMKEIGKFQAVEGVAWNHPALVRGRLLVRTDREAACYDLRPKTEVAAKE